MAAVFHSHTEQLPLWKEGVGGVVVNCIKYENLEAYFADVPQGMGEHSLLLIFDILFYHWWQVLVFEDAPNGVESAKSAGMNVVMVPHKRTDPEKCHRADRVLTTLEELDLKEWGLPPLPVNAQ